MAASKHETYIVKYEALKKHADRYVKIRPALQRYDDLATLEMTLEDAWFLTEVTPEGARLQNRATAHSRILGLDNIHHYMEDPDGKHTEGTRGILVLNVQLLIFKGKLLLEPVAPPGTSLKSFTPTQTRDDLFTIAKRRQAEMELTSKKNEFATSADGIRMSDEAFYELLAAFSNIETILRKQGNPIDIVIKHSGLQIVVGAFGWWASITWEHYMNTLQDSRLTIRKWDGHPPYSGFPPYPDVMLIRQSNCVAIDQFTFGLVNLSEASWIDLSNSQHHLTSMEIAENILQDFIDNPLAPPAVWYE